MLPEILSSDGFTLRLTLRKTGGFMASDDRKTTFPVIPSAHWWVLRKKFKQSIPGIVTDNYIASVLDMQLSSARANVLPALKATKIIDGDGKPLDRATRWRDDDQYSKVCEEIRRDIYPEELLAGIPNPSTNRNAAERWFANHTGGGEAAVRKITQFYMLLSEADPSKAPDGSEPSSKVKPQGSIKANRKTQKPTLLQTSLPVTQETLPKDQGRSPSTGPSVHITLQIHISADASTDQIEQVFASMAKHIYKGGVAE
jgi:hypothetical protein